MVQINDNYLKLAAGYLFPEIDRRVREFTDANPNAQVIRLGIGDVTRPLPDAVVQGIHKGVDDQADAATFKGYGPEQGYRFLRECIAEHDYGSRGVTISPDEIFVSDGSKCDSGNIQEIFSADARIAVGDPVYPVYVDTNVMAGRSGPINEEGHYEGLIYMPCTEANGFQPDIPSEQADLIYLCSPNNPTGSVATKEQLRRWVDWARANDAILLFDAAYVDYITDDSLPHSIFDIEGARQCAIEFRSFSKNVGYTGTRCAFTVIPNELKGRSACGDEVSIHHLWSRRHSTKFNGTSYPIQVGAAAAYTPEGQAQVAELVAYYLENARIIREGLTAAGYTIFGGVHAPYIWLRTPKDLRSWDFFDQLLGHAHVVGTPGSGFGPRGEGYFRLSAFGNRDQVEEAVRRIQEKFPQA